MSERMPEERLEEIRGLAQHEVEYWQEDELPADIYTLLSESIPELLAEVKQCWEDNKRMEKVLGDEFGV